MRSRIYMLQNVLPSVAEQLAESTTDASVRSAFQSAIKDLRDCATAVTDATDALSHFTRAISQSFMTDDSPIDPYILEIGKLYEAYMDRLEDVLGSAGRSSDALGRLDGIIIHAMSYPLVVDYVFVNVLFPFIARHRLVDLSSRAIMLTTGRTTLHNVRSNVHEIADLARLLKAYAADARAHFRLDAIVGIRALPTDKRLALNAALDAVYFDLRSGVHGMESASRQIGWATNILGY